ncbi:suppressor APC domain-containing protein 2 isoform X3 [Macaca fascicularis]|uniref:suppressor APC domain-containing protein 2 isoform X3 n=1 Tax=Macaca fascicularis TaxID=9541 RepID=UPI003D15EC9F
MAGAAMAERGRVPPPAPAPGTEGLPRAFLQSLRTLFDILDDRRRGCVHLREIESRWQGTDARELPCGVLEGLRQVAPASGYLTFERFVAGLRTSLLSADGGPRDPTRAPARPGDQPPPPPQRLVFAPADEPRTVLERKPLPLGVRAPLAGPSGAARSPEQLCAPAEAAPCPADPERSQSAALEPSSSADAGEGNLLPVHLPRGTGLGSGSSWTPDPGGRLRGPGGKGASCLSWCSGLQGPGGGLRGCPAGPPCPRGTSEAHYHQRRGLRPGKLMHAWTCACSLGPGIPCTCTCCS